MEKKVAICFGNGPSRKGLDFKKFVQQVCDDNGIMFLSNRLVTVGSNFFYKEYGLVDYIVAWDPDPAIIGMQQFGYSNMIIPDPLKRRQMASNSGLYSIWWSVNSFQANEVMLVGFDHLIADDPGKTLTDSIIKTMKENKVKGTEFMGHCNSLGKDSSCSRGRNIINLIKQSNKVHFSVCIPARKKLHPDLVGVQNAKRELLPKKFFKKEVDTNEAKC